MDWSGLLNPTSVSLALLIVALTLVWAYVMLSGSKQPASVSSLYAEKEGGGERRKSGGGKTRKAKSNGSPKPGSESSTSSPSSKKRKKASSLPTTSPAPVTMSSTAEPAEADVNTEQPSPENTTESVEEVGVVRGQSEGTEKQKEVRDEEAGAKKSATGSGRGKARRARAAAAKAAVSSGEAAQRAEEEEEEGAGEWKTALSRQQLRKLKKKQQQQIKVEEGEEEEIRSSPVSSDSVEGDKKDSTATSSPEECEGVEDVETTGQEQELPVASSKVMNMEQALKELGVVVQKAPLNGRDNQVVGEGVGV